MTIDDIKAAIERRGYSVQVEHYPYSVNFRISVGEKHMNCGYTLVDLKYCKLSLTDFVNAMLYRFSGTMQYMWCKQCHEPLLRYIDQALALRYLQTSTKPDVVLEVADKTIAASIVRAGLPVLSKDVRIVYGLNREDALARASVYRSMKAGPDSPILDSCPQCRQRLYVGSVEEIQDA